MFMSCLIETWHAKRSPCAASRLVICPNSVGRISPPPDLTFTLHCPQVPPPPQAEDTNKPLSARAVSSFEPEGT